MSKEPDIILVAHNPPKNAVHEARRIRQEKAAMKARWEKEERIAKLEIELAFAVLVFVMLLLSIYMAMVRQSAVFYQTIPYVPATQPSPTETGVIINQERL